MGRSEGKHRQADDRAVKKPTERQTQTDRHPPAPLYAYSHKSPAVEAPRVKVPIEWNAGTDLRIVVAPLLLHSCST